MTEHAVRVFGTPTPQGSMTCKAKHVTRANLQPSNKTELKKWRALVAKAGRALPVTGLAGPLGVEVTLTVARPKTVTRDWPHQKANRSGHGGDIDKLVGDHGEVLDALQELTRLAAMAETGQRSRLMLDIAGYRARRREELGELGRSTAEQVAASGEPVRLAPMNPFERKVVHDAVGTVAGVESSSEGEEPRRRVVISPVS